MLNGNATRVIRTALPTGFSGGCSPQFALAGNAGNARSTFSRNALSANRPMLLMPMRGERSN